MFAVDVLVDPTQSTVTKDVVLFTVAGAGKALRAPGRVSNRADQSQSARLLCAVFSARAAGKAMPANVAGNGGNA
jgi:hypothetical protein